MTQPWGTQQPGQSGQSPGPQQWNQPAQAWPNAGTTAAGGGQYGQTQQYLPYQAQQYQGQSAYGQQPGSFAPIPPRRKNPMRTLLFGAVLVIGIFFFAVTLMDYLGSDDTESSTGSASTSTSGSQTSTGTDGVEAPDSNPSELPSPQTYAQATKWITSNAVYSQSPQIPTDCSVPEIDMTTASVSKLETHLNQLTACLVKVWQPPLVRAGFELPRPPVTVYTSAITTKCGKLDDINAVYCSADQHIYYSQKLYQIFPKDQQKARFVTETVLAHEFGHTIQARTGILISSMAWEQRAEENSTTEAHVWSRRLEMQADCFSGMFSESVAQASGLSQSDLTNLRDVMGSLGDDALTGQANYDGDHGSSAARKRWYTTGQTSTSMGACNTYTAAASQVR